MIRALSFDNACMRSFRHTCATATGAVMLRRAGWSVGRNVVYRLYREEGLALRSKRPRRRKMVVHRDAASLDAFQ